MSAKGITRRCSSCGGRCYWADDFWTCFTCGDEWNEDHGMRYAAPWSTDDERRIAQLRVSRSFGSEYKRLRHLETLEAARRRSR